MEKVVVNGETGEVERVTLSSQEAAAYLALQQALQLTEQQAQTSQHIVKSPLRAFMSKPTATTDEVATALRALVHQLGLG